MITPTSTTRIVVVGATGLIGSAIMAELREVAAERHYELLGVTHGTRPGLDLTNPHSIGAFFDTVGTVDHVVVAAGDARFGTFAQLDAAAFEVGLRSKLMGQVNLAMTALSRLPTGGSVTLTSGALAHTPIAGSAAVALVNGALDSFVRAIAIDVPDRARVNVVSPGWLRETRVRMGLPPEPGVSAREVAAVYRRAIESTVHGQVLEVEARAGVDVQPSALAQART